ncbi:MAG: sulfatase-like hydrolase/transferase [Phycisphaeraceae bacterium]|nr:sulfatase-like hydrolase/transferase [Phycisphaeraceae bacterium]
MYQGLKRLFACASVVTAWCAAVAAQPGGGPPQARPNILFVILDDVGIDQFAIFNPLAEDGVQAPTLEAVAAAGVKFTNFHVMPECSPSRVSFFTGRYPLRTGVTAAILELDQPNAQISAYETTTPMVLRRAQYRSALIGKYHLGGPSNNPLGYSAPAGMGWDFFDGTLVGAPPPMDPTLGGQYTEDRTTYGWGFPIGNELGVGWFLNADGSIRCDDNGGAGYTGNQVVTLGGIPALNAAGEFAASCAEAISSGRQVVFGEGLDGYNGYYSWPHTINDGNRVYRDTTRGYATSVQTDAAISWIRGQPSRPNRPWMCTVSYSAIHTPYQPPPEHLYPEGFVWPEGVPQDDPQDPDAIRVVSDLMLYAIDKELGRLLVNIGMAKYGPDGGIVYDPRASNTMLIIVGDNGTYIQSVKRPYNQLRAKATPYQTGVLAPMVVAGPLVKTPGREVHHLVDSVDLFQLFGEIAGVDVRREVPGSRVLDSRPVLGYLTNPSQGSMREFSYGETGPGLKSIYDRAWPGVVELQVGPILVSVCIDTLLSNQQVADLEGATWYGPGTPLQLDSCCEVRDVVYNGDASQLMILPARTWSLRNDRYKIVKFLRPQCDSGLGEYEFYDLTPTPHNPLNPLGLDNGPSQLLDNGNIPAWWNCDTPGIGCDRLTNYNSLRAALDALFASEPRVEGDGNLDKRVTGEDVGGVRRYWGQPSWFDFNNDGTTDQQDMDIVLRNLRGR